MMRQEAINKALRQLEQLRKNLPKPTALDLVVLYLKRNEEWIYKTQ